MPCYSPLSGWYSKNPNPSGKHSIVFDKKYAQLDAEVRLPCGKCIGCRLERSKVWAIRCAHEASLHTNNCFITLTYDNDNLPADGSLTKPHWQQFMKNLRKRLVPKNPFSPRPPNDATDPDLIEQRVQFDLFQEKHRISFYMCGEYGQDQEAAKLGFDRLGRPHFHAILFNFNPITQGKLVYSKASLSNSAPTKYGNYREVEKSQTGEDQFESSVIDSCWGKGRARISLFSFDAAAYVARYCTKTLDAGITPDQEAKFIDHYTKYDEETGSAWLVEPEFNLMSRNPSIGKTWFNRYNKELSKGYITINGTEVSIPDYYLTLMDKDVDLSNQLSDIKALRSEFLASKDQPDSFDLRISEEIRLKQIRSLKRE